MAMMELGTRTRTQALFMGGSEPFLKVSVGFFYVILFSLIKIYTFFRTHQNRFGSL